jgi:hypothetical protein
MFGSEGRVPFGERGGRVRGMLDVVAGRYPSFLFGGAVGDVLPVFHFHQVIPDELEPQLQYLAENGYRTVTSSAVTRLVRDGISPPARAVMLAFDDAWSTLWTVAAPLLRRYEMQAVTYAIPGRIRGAAAVRSTIDDGLRDPDTLDNAPDPLATWPELKQLHSEGIIDVQSHTLTHSMMFASPVITGFVSPEFETESPLDRPRLDRDGVLRFLAPSALGAPLYVRRSRMSDALRFFPDPDQITRCVEHVRTRDGRAFFGQRGWREELRRVAGAPRGTSENPSARDAAIEEELRGGREQLEAALPNHHVDHICLPWGVAGMITWRLLERCGYRTAFANRFRGRFAVAADDPPYALKRLSNRFISTLPGRGRRFFFSA